MKRLLRRLEKCFRRPSSRPAPAPEASPTVHRGVAARRPCPAKPQADAPLERLPPEVRRQLLSILKLEELRALLFASPVFYQQFLLHRRFLLLDATLRGVAVDACAAYQSGLAAVATTRTDQSVAEFLRSYHQSRSVAGYCVLAQPVTEHQVVEMAAFHFPIVRPLAKHYLGWTLANVDKFGCHSSRDALSYIEEMRLWRAFYRFQLCCNIFGNSSHEMPIRSKLNPQSIDILNLFMCHFEPWQVEEIACIYAYAEKRFDGIFDDISWDVNENNPKFDGQRPPTPDGAFDLGNSWVRDGLLRGTISHGLELLHTVLFRIKDHAHLVTTMQEETSWPLGDFLGFSLEALGETAQFNRRHHRP